MNETTEAESMHRQLEVAIAVLHVIAVMGEMDSKQCSEMALDALREMETYGMMYEMFDQYGDDV
jgi:hypothetical protein